MTSVKKTKKLKKYHAASKQAMQILRDNICEVITQGKIYRRTVPSKEFYVHQWKWDSESVAMGLIHFDEELAWDELRALLAGQWENGMIGHVTYNKDETKYYPQHYVWRTEKFSQNGIITSGITQPPILGIALEYLYQHASSKQKAQQLLAEFLPALIKYHNYLKAYRDPENMGLLTVIHPWESGTDNSPRWDQALLQLDLKKIPPRVKDDVHKNRTDNTLGKKSHRPHHEDYYRFLGLIDMYADMNWDYEKIVKTSPFAVKDIIFTSIWVKANEALAMLLEETGETKFAAKYRSWAKQSQKALSQTWDPKTKQFCDIDVNNGHYKLLHTPTIAMFLPLYAGAVTEQQLDILLTRLFNPREFWTKYPVPSTPANSPFFEIARYWRGPTWPLTNFFIYEGLKRYEKKHPLTKRMARILLEKSLDMIVEKGWYESFSPHEDVGEEEHAGFGFGKFSWTAAIFLQLFERYKKALAEEKMQKKQITANLQQPKIAAVLHLDE